MKYLAYIESPLQAFNLMEFVNKNGITLDYLVVNKKTLVSKLNYSQICYVLKYIKCLNVSYIDVESNKSNISKIKGMVRKIPFSSTDDVSIIGGEYRSLIFWFMVGYFKKRQVYIVDDGTATLRLNRRTRSFKGWLRAKVLSLLGACDSYNERITFISVYDIIDRVSKKDRVINHKYDYFKSLTEGFSNDKDIVYVIGTPLLEAGVVRGEDIEITLKLISDLKCISSGKTLVYIPHRRERLEKIESIKEVVEVQYLDFPFELLPLVSGNNVKNIAGFYSSLFDNMLSIYGGNLTINSFYVPEYIITPEWTEFVNQVYYNYKRYEGDSFTFNSLEG